MDFNGVGQYLQNFVAKLDHRQIDDTALMLAKAAISANEETPIPDRVRMFFLIT